MGIFMPGRRATPRRFSYEPRYYNPDKDDNLKRRMRIQSASRSKRRNPSIIYMITLLVVAFYLYTVLA